VVLKKHISKQTWQHPKSGVRNCIGYILMQQKDRHSCLDVSVKRAAVCNTDYNLVCMELKLEKPYKSTLIEGLRRGGLMYHS